jgi:hypothetical protein
VVSGKDYGQSFITDAGPERTLAMMKELKIPGDVYEVDGGRVKPTKV